MTISYFSSLLWPLLHLRVNILNTEKWTFILYVHNHTIRYDWGDVTHKSVGVLRSIDRNGSEVVVDFPECNGWMGLTSEMEHAHSRYKYSALNATVYINLHYRSVPGKRLLKCYSWFCPPMGVYLEQNIHTKAATLTLWSVVPRCGHLSRTLRWLYNI